MSLMNSGALDGIIGAGISAATSLITNRQNIKFQQQANEQNIALQRDINQQNLDNQWNMWNATNDYNSPAQQMARYREAGLNPNLVYGQSNTAQAMNVGTAQAPRVEAKKVDFSQFANVASTYLDLLSKQQMVQKQKIENDIAGATYDDVVKQAGLTTQHLEKMITRVDKEIESIGLKNTYQNYQNQLQEFEKSMWPVIKQLKENELKMSNNNLSLSDAQVDMIPLMKQLKRNELSLSNAQVDMIPTMKLQAMANLRLANVTIGLTKMKQALTQAQTRHELKKINLTETQRQSYIQQIDESLKRVEKMSAEIEDINFRNSNPYRMSGGIFGSVGNFSFGMTKNLEQIIKGIF